MWVTTLYNRTRSAFIIQPKQSLINCITVCDYVCITSNLCHICINCELHICYTWATCEIHMCYMWVTYVLHVSYICVTCELHMCYMWVTYVLHVSYICVTCELHMRYMCVAYELHVCCIWVTCQLYESYTYMLKVSYTCYIYIACELPMCYMWVTYVLHVTCDLYVTGFGRCTVWLCHLQLIGYTRIQTGGVHVSSSLNWYTYLLKALLNQSPGYCVVHYRDQTSLDAKLGSLTYMARGTNTNLGLRNAREQCFGAGNGMRSDPDVKKLVILVTDGISTSTIEWV